MADSPIVAKTYDFLVWLIPQTLKFPKSQRLVLAKVRPNREVLVEADVELEKVRLHLRLAQELKLMNAGQYEHASRAVVEIGRLLDGWLKRDPDGRDAFNELRAGDPA